MTTTNTSSRHRLVCPRCGNTSRFTGFGVARLNTTIGLLDTAGAPEWEPGSRVTCCSCGMTGKADRFMTHSVSIEPSLGQVPVSFPRVDIDPTVPAAGWFPAPEGLTAATVDAWIDRVEAGLLAVPVEGPSPGDKARELLLATWVAIALNSGGLVLTGSMAPALADELVQQVVSTYMTMLVVIGALGVLAWLLRGTEKKRVRAARRRCGLRAVKVAYLVRRADLRLDAVASSRQ